MELKYADGEILYRTLRSNRTFMELKYVGVRS